jgi:MFS family permease
MAVADLDEKPSDPSSTSPPPQATAEPVSSSSSSIHSQHKQDATPSTPTPFKPTLRLVLAFAALAVLTLMVALDGTSISVALPTIAERLHGSALEAFWAGTSFLLASTVFQPTFASFSHIFGRMPMVIVAVTLFLAGVLMAALAQDFALLLVGRTIQGVGGGAVIALTEIIVTDLVPMRYRGQWMGILAGMWALGSVSGPIIGGAFAQVGEWRWIFW